MSARMTHRERLLAAARLQAVDKVPCSPRDACGLRILYNDYTSRQHQLLLTAAQDPDVDMDPHWIAPSGVPYLVGCYGSLYLKENAHGLADIQVTVDRKEDGECFLCTRTIATPAGKLREVVKVPKPGSTAYGLAPNPAFVEHAIKERSDLEKVRYLVPNPSQYEVAHAYHEQVRLFGENGLVLAEIRCPLDHRAGALRDLADLMVDYYEDRAFFDAQLKIWFDSMMAETRACLENGVQVVFGSWFFASLSAGWSPTIWRQCFAPMVNAHVQLVHSYGALYDYYDDGKVMGILDIIKEAGVDVFETLTPPPMGDVNLAEVKRRIGDRVCLKGYGDLLYVLKMGTPEKVEAMVKEAIETAGPTGFVMGTCDSIREGTPRENIVAYFHAARKHGRVPTA